MLIWLHVGWGGLSLSDQDVFLNRAGITPDCSRHTPPCSEFDPGFSGSKKWRWVGPETERESLEDSVENMYSSSMKMVDMQETADSYHLPLNISALIHGPSIPLNLWFTSWVVFPPSQHQAPCCTQLCQTCHIPQNHSHPLCESIKEQGCNDECSQEDIKGYTQVFIITSSGFMGWVFRHLSYLWYSLFLL